MMLLDNYHLHEQACVYKQCRFPMQTSVGLNQSLSMEFEMSTIIRWMELFHVSSSLGFHTKN